MEHEKIQAIQEWLTPKSVKQLRAFLRLAGYYKRFVAGFASISAPLTQLLRKDAFVWGGDLDQAFETLKQALTNTPVLKLPNFMKKFIVQTYESHVGAGAVLLQGGHPIAYFSKQMGSKLQIVSTYSREMWAILEAVHKWCQYLLGVPFEVQTDHKSLKALLDQVVQTPEQQLWVSKLQGYDFTITYKPGKDNTPPDALSHLLEMAYSAILGHSKPIVTVLDALREFTRHHEKTSHLLVDIQ